MKCKRLFKLSPRLQMCANMINPNASIVDVGTDHAYLPIWLARMGRISKAIACDINLMPLERAKKNIDKYEVSSIIETRISDGLKGINEGEVDEIIIAGMGGELIAKIIEDTEWIKSKKLILNPMSSDMNLRVYLSKNGYEINEEVAVLSDNKVYTVMNCEYTGKENNYCDEYYFVGKLLENNLNKDTLIYINNQIKDLKNRKKGEEIKQNYSNVRRIEKVIEYLSKYLNN